MFNWFPNVPVPYCLFLPNLFPIVNLFTNIIFSEGADERSRVESHSQR